MMALWDKITGRREEESLSTPSHVSYGTSSIQEQDASIQSNVSPLVQSIERDNQPLLLKTPPSHPEDTPQGPPSSSNSPSESNPGTIAAIVAFYFVSSISVVLCLKLVYADGGFAYPYPITSTCASIGIQALLSVLGSILATRFKFLSFIPPWESPLKWQYSKIPQFLPVSAVYIAHLLFSHLCLNYVEVSFFQVCRSLIIPFNLILGYLINKDLPSRLTLYSCLIIVAGYILGSVGEVRFSGIGLFYGGVASALIALSSIMVKSSLKLVDGNAFKLQAYTNTLGFLINIPLCFIEYPAAFEVPFLFDSMFIAMIFMTASAGYLVGIAIFLQIKYTSPLTNNISGNAKSCAQTFLSVWLFENPISILNACGLAISIFGSFLYGHIRHSEMKINAATAKEEAAKNSVHQEPVPTPAKDQ